MGRRKSKRTDDTTQKNSENSSEMVHLKVETNGDAAVENIDEAAIEKKNIDVKTKKNSDVINNEVKKQEKSEQEEFEDVANQIYEKQHGHCVLKEFEGDLFESPSDFALAHGVAEDLRMSIGIAAEFRRRYNGITQLLKQTKKVGEVAILNTDDRRFVYYLIIKEGTYDMPTMESVQMCIKLLYQHCKENNIKKLAIPPIGFGRDRLDWFEVRKLITSAFEDLDIEIRVYKYNKILQSRRELDWKKTGENYGRRPPSRFNGPPLASTSGRNSYDNDFGGNGGGGNGSSRGGRWLSGGFNDPPPIIHRGNGYNDDAAPDDGVIQTRVFVNSKLKKRFANGNDRRNAYDGRRD